MKRPCASLLDRSAIPRRSSRSGPRPAGGPLPRRPPPCAGERPQPYVERTEDGIAVITANDYRQFSAENTGWVKIIADFKKAFTEAAGSSRVLIDLRNLGGPYSYLLGMAVSDNLSRLLARDISCRPSAS